MENNLSLNKEIIQRSKNIIVYIVKQKHQKVRRFYKKNSLNFQILLKIEFCWRENFEILFIYKPSLRTCEVPREVWSRSVQTF